MGDRILTEILFLVGVSLALIAVPIFRTQWTTFYYTYEKAKNNLLIIIAGLLCIAALFGGFPVPADLSMWALFYFTCYLSLSALWSDNPRDSIDDLPRYWALFVFALICTQMPRNLLLQAVFIPSPFIAAYGLSNRILKRDILDRGMDGFVRKQKQRDRVRTTFISWLGNYNYIGAYLAPQFFIGLYLINHISLWYAIPYMIVVAGIIMCGCKGAQIGVIIGSIFVMPHGVILLPVAIVMGYVMFKLKPNSFIGRLPYISFARVLLKRNPLFGCGPRVVRRKVYRVQATLSPRKHYSKCRRLHNDHLETLVEAGLFGFLLYALFVGTALGNAISHPYLLGCLVAVLVNALVFYPLRTAATALPFFAVVGTLAVPGAFVNVPFYFALFCTALIGYLIYWFPIRHYRLQRYLYLAGNETNAGNALQFLTKAQLLYPKNNALLWILANAYTFLNHVESFKYIINAIYNFDGEVIEWDLYSFAGARARMNGSKSLAYNLYKQALVLNREEPGAKAYMKHIEEEKKNVK